MNIRPLRNNVVVERLDADEKTPGGLIIPDNAKEKQTRGKVLAVGPGRVTEYGKFVETTVKVGETVVFGKYAGAVVPGNDKQVILGEDDILAVIENSVTPG